MDTETLGAAAYGLLFYNKTIIRSWGIKAMRIGIPVLTGGFAVLLVTLAVQLIPWVGFAWLDEAMFVGYVLGGHRSLAPVVGLLPLLLVGVAAAAFSWKWALSQPPKGAFFRGLVAGLGLYVVAVAVSNPFRSTFHGQFDGQMPPLAENMLSATGWFALVESFLGHLIFGLVLGLFYALLATPVSVQVKPEEDPVSL